MAGGEKNFEECCAELSLDGLRSPLLLQHGNIYALSEEDDRLADVLLWTTVADAVSAGRSVCVISASRAARSIDQSGYADIVYGMLDGPGLTILEAASSGFPDMQSIVSDLEYWKAGIPQLIVVDGAESIFTAFDPATVEAWCTWARQHHVAVLLLYRQLGVNGNESLAKLRPCSSLFAGMARLKSRYGVPAWEIFHWFGPGGLIAPAAYPLRRNAQGRLEIVDAETASTAAAEIAPDEMHVIVQRSAFQPKETVVAGWHTVDGNVDDMLAAAGNATAATIVLSYTPGTDYHALVRCIFELRKRHGVLLKIVVREVNARLRYSQETLAVRVGANLIVPAEISYSRFLSLTSMVQGQVFPHHLPATFEQALRDVAPEQEQGYLPPAEFIQAVNNMLERSRMLHVQNALLRLPLAYGLLPLDALRYCNIKRAGDLCTADVGSVYLFLYACRETDVDKTLERVFGLPVGELFASEDRIFSYRTIHDAMSDLEARHQVEHYPDHSEGLAAVGPVKAGQAAETAPVAETERKGPAVERYAAPKPAVRRPLLVKGPPTLTEVSAITP